MHIRSGPSFLQAQRCGALFPSAPLIRAAFPKPVTQNPAGLPSGIKDCVHRAIAQTPAVRGQGFANLQQGSLKWPYLLGGGLMLLGVSGAKMHAESRTPEQIERQINALLEIDKKERTMSKTFELYRCLLTLGRERIKQAKGKDITVVYGKTGAGKSALINYVYGCDMREDECGRIVVDEKSGIKSVAPIVHGGKSGTPLPQLIPGVTFDVAEDKKGELNLKKGELNLCDIAGLCDNRGIEVVIANAVLLKDLVKQAKSVKFVLVFDIRGLEARGESWVEVALLLQDTFEGVIGRGQNSLSVILTRSHNLAKEKKSIQALDKGSVSDELARLAITYDPLNSKRRDDLRIEILSTKSHENLDPKMSLGGAQCHQAIKLGEKIGRYVDENLPKENTWPLALEGILFTHDLTRLGNQDLKDPHKKASKPVLELASSLIRQLDPGTSNAKPEPNENEKAIGEKYKRLEGYFGSYVNFSKPNIQFKNVLQKFDDTQVSWGRQAANLGVIASSSIVAATSYAVGGTVVAVAMPVTLAIVAGSTAIAATYCGYRWMFPSEEETKTAEFFRV